MDKQTHAEGEKAGGETYQVPEKFKGATPEETIAKMGKSYSELEKELGDRSKSSAETEAIKSSLTELHKAIESLKPKEENPDDLAAQNTKVYLDGLGYATKEDVAKAREEGFKEYKLQQTVEQLRSKYDGKDGKPIFAEDDIKGYANQNGLQSLPPEQVYKLKFEKELLDWNVKEALKGNRAPSVPGAGKGAQQPAEPDYSKMKPSELETMARENALKRIQAQEASV